jgi:uncharacterized protein (DUF58 family)
MPTRRLVAISTAMVVLAVVVAILPTLKLPYLVLAALLAAIALADLATVALQRRPTAARELPSRMALGARQQVVISLRNPSQLPAHLLLFDDLPDSATPIDLPWSGTVPPGHFAKITYTLQPLRRGRQHFGLCHVFLSSPLRLWRRRLKLGEPGCTKVFPNYEPVIRLSLLAMANRDNQMGIVLKSRAGVSKEFHQLRDYQDSDVLSQIDWKATARRRQLVSREFEEQRDQTLMLLLDSSSRMRGMDGSLSQFDHALNTALLLAYVALRQGDHVGALSFSGDDRWLPPSKGTSAMPRLLDHLYDCETSAGPPDFAAAAQALLARQRRRALIVIFTNLRTEGASDLIPSLRILSQRHLVVLASLKERTVLDLVESPVGSLDDALSCAAAHLYLEGRTRLLSSLEASRILTVDEPAQSFPVALANRYLEIKRRALL